MVRSAYTLPSPDSTLRDFTRYVFSTIKFIIFLWFWGRGLGFSKWSPGDLLSPFLFIPAMERELTQMLEKDRELQWIQGFRVGRNPSTTIIVSHLLYVDDTLIFCGADCPQSQHLSNGL